MVTDLLTGFPQQTEFSYSSQALTMPEQFNFLIHKVLLTPHNGIHYLLPFETCKSQLDTSLLPKAAFIISLSSVDKQQSLDITY